MRITPCITSVLLAVASLTAAAQKPAAYPAKGQTASQQSSDDTQCLGWAEQSTGIDPASMATVPSQQTAPRGERLGGAMRGAAGGAVIGEIADGDSSKGASIGATAGVLAGGARARRNHAAQAQQAQAAQVQNLDTYYRAYGACMQGKGYTVD